MSAASSSQEIYKAEISENAQVGDEVTTVEATSDNEVVYDLFNLPDSFPFNISSSSGTIQLATSLNRETTSFYTFPVRAMNTDSEVAIALVEVTISDENDNPPVIAPSLISVSLAENHGLSEIVSFSCSDEDTGSNGIVEFELPFGNEEGKFSISESGTMAAAAEIDDLELLKSTSTIVAVVVAGVAAGVVALPDGDADKDIAHGGGGVAGVVHVFVCCWR